MSLDTCKFFKLTQPLYGHTGPYQYSIKFALANGCIVVHDATGHTTLLLG